MECGGGVESALVLNPESVQHPTGATWLSGFNCIWLLCYSCGGAPPFSLKPPGLQSTILLA